MMKRRSIPSVALLLSTVVGCQPAIEANDTDGGASSS